MNHAEVAELADALDSKSSVVAPRAGSSPAFGTSKSKPFMLMTWKVFLFFPLFDANIDVKTLLTSNAFRILYTQI